MNVPDDRLRRGVGQRLWSTAKVAASAAKLAGQSLLTERADADGAIGDALFGELDRMKGVAMKVGQILSYFDGALPEATHAALRRLQTGTEPLDFALVARVVEDTFGAPIAALYESFEERPIAAASVGQVHRARYQGQPVAVKVQYPGIAETMVSDFSRLTALSKLASLATAVDGPSLVRELAARMQNECDYEFEAEQQRYFRHAFRDDPEVRIPEVVAERTRRTVLTSAFEEGADLYTFAEHAPAQRRDAAGLLLARFAFHSLFGLGRLNADPHPGNYLFPERGVVFLDFGCVTVFEPEFIERERELFRVVIEIGGGPFAKRCWPRVWYRPPSASISTVIGRCSATSMPPTGCPTSASLPSSFATGCGSIAPTIRTSVSWQYRHPGSGSSAWSGVCTRCWHAWALPETLPR